MAQNLFDDAMEQLGGPASSASQGPSTGLYDDALQALRDQESANAASLRVAPTSSPEQTAEARRLAMKYGVPSTTVERDIKHYQNQEQGDMAVRVMTGHPQLGDWMAARPENHAAVADDLAQMSVLDRTLGIGRNIAGAAGEGIMGFSAGMWGVIQLGAEAFDKSVNSPLGSETTKLTPDQETQFKQWATDNNVQDLDSPESFYDYRGWWVENKGAPRPMVTDPKTGEEMPGHWPDTYKQHGHPTFSIESQYSHALWDGGSWDGDTFVPSPTAQLATFARGAQAVAQHLADKARGDQRGAGFYEKAAYSGISSVTQMAPGMLTAALSGGALSGVALGTALEAGGSAGILTLAGLSTGGSAYSQARDQGVGIGKAAAFASFQGAVEVATEFIPAERLLGDLGKNASIVKIIAHQFLPEIGGEEVATALQDLGEWAALPANKDRTFSDYLNERPSAAAATAVSVIVSLGATGIVTHATRTLVERFGTFAEESKTAKRAPDVIRDYVQSKVGGTNLETLYAPIKSWNEYWQSKGVDPAEVATQVTGSATAYQNAIDENIDLAIPTANYVSQLAGTEHNAFFSKELRVDPQELNEREQGELNDHYSKQLDALLTADGSANASELAQAHQQFHDDLVQQLVEAGANESDAHTQATIVAAGLQGLSTRSGLNVFERNTLNVEQEQTTRPAQPVVATTEELNQAPPRLKEIKAEVDALVEKTGGNLTAQQAARYTELMKEVSDIRYEQQQGKPLDVAKIGTPEQRMSTLDNQVIQSAHTNLLANKDIYDAIHEAAAGAAFNATTAVDDIMAGDDPNVTPSQFYDQFATTREALRQQYGDTVTAYRAVGQQRSKATTNWATTEAYAKQFGKNVVSKEIPVDHILAVNVGPSGRYHELIVGNPPQAELNQAQAKKAVSVHPRLTLNPAERTQGALLVSTAVAEGPSAVPSETRRRTDQDIVLQDPEKTAQAAATLRGWQLLTPKEKKLGDKKVIRAAIDSMKANLKLLWDTYPTEWRDRARHWYVGANRIAHELGAEFGATVDQAAGVLAALSPQMDWFRNVSLARRVMSLQRQFENTNQEFTKELNDKFAEKWKSGTDLAFKKIAQDYAKNGEEDVARRQANMLAERGAEEALVEANVGKHWKELDAFGKARLLRAYDEVHNSRQYAVITPEGESVGQVLNKPESRTLKSDPRVTEVTTKGKPKGTLGVDYTEKLDADGKRIGYTRTVEPRVTADETVTENEDGTFTVTSPGAAANVGWGTYQFIEAAISIMENGSVENIDASIGYEHKVRSFFNNISHPWDADSVTIDTHAVAAALIKSLSGASPEVKATMGGKGGPVSTRRD